MPESPSSRRAWIEICWARSAVSLWDVAFLAEGVDRNTFLIASRILAQPVAFLAEGVDRNTLLPVAFET